ncbi:MAG: hypothetical protein RIB32_02305 [Phycisphaerales bacterium]
MALQSKQEALDHPSVEFRRSWLGYGFAAIPFCTIAGIWMIGFLTHQAFDLATLAILIPVTALFLFMTALAVADAVVGCVVLTEDQAKFVTFGFCRQSASYDKIEMVQRHGLYAEVKRAGQLWNPQVPFWTRDYGRCLAQIEDAAKRHRAQHPSEGERGVS